MGLPMPWPLGAWSEGAGGREAGSRHAVTSRLFYDPAFQGTLQPWFTKSAEEPAYSFVDIARCGRPE